MCRSCRYFSFIRAWSLPKFHMSLCNLPVARADSSAAWTTLSGKVVIRLPNLTKKQIHRIPHQVAEIMGLFFNLR